MFMGCRNTVSSQPITSFSPTSDLALAEGVNEIRDRNIDKVTKRLTLPTSTFLTGESRRIMRKLAESVLHILEIQTESLFQSWGMVRPLL
jgi:hypothetical protein